MTNYYKYEKNLNKICFFQLLKNCTPFLVHKTSVHGKKNQKH
jgi:hypothetical protein